MKCLSVVLVIILLIQIGYVPCAAQEAVILKGDEIDKSKLRIGAYVEVSYRSKDRRKTSRGRIVAVGEDGFTVTARWRKTIEYRNVLELIAGPTQQDVVRLKAIAAVAEGAPVRITQAPSISKRRLVGSIVTLSADSLVLKLKKQDMPLTIPLASVTNLEVGVGKKGNAAKGAFIGLLAGAGFGAVAGYNASFGGGIPFGGVPTQNKKLGPGGAAIFGVVFGALGAGIGGVIGVTIRTEQWDEVPIDRLRVSLSPQRHGGIVLSASFAF